MGLVLRRRGNRGPARRRIAASLAAALALLCLGAGGGSAPAAAAEPVTVGNYTDPGQAMKWGNRSHWMQPWRSYLETVPATTLLDAIGINFNVSPKVAAPTARLLADSGFRRARIEVGWGTIDYDDPSRMNSADRRSLVTTLTALRENGIRPLILLNANQGKPCPVKTGTVELTAAAAAGATEVHVDPADRAAIMPGRTGISSDGIAAQILFTAVDPDGTVHLSKPLPTALPAGALNVATLRYEPFHPATLADGSPNPAFAPTMDAWLDYVGVVSREVKSILGSEEFDVEVWNELSFGSAFLNINTYYSPHIEWTKNGNLGQILFRTVAYLRDPANGVADIGIGNGFASESPFWSASNSPVGLSALDKHPYAGWHSFPAAAQVNGNRPLDGRGEPAGWRDAEGQYHESFTPTYQDFFPEHFLSGIQTETLIHDLSPRPSLVGKVEHGRLAHPPGGEAPAVWITEANLGPGSGPTPRGQMSAADIRHIESKDILRYLAAYVNKGVTAIDFYAADAGDLSLIDAVFLKAAKANPSAFPGDALGGETTDAVRRLVAAMAGAEAIADPRRLTLRELTDFSANVQFQGDGTAAYPPLYNRDVFGFFPFQVSAARFVIPVYVMTRNVAEVHGAASAGPSRFDLPAEPYRLAIGGIDGEAAQVSASDPLAGTSVPVEVVSRSSDEVVVELPVTDSVRLLTIEDDGRAPPVEPEPELPLEPEDEGEEAAGKSPEPGPAGEPAAAKARTKAPPAPAPVDAGGTAVSLDLRGGRALLRTRRLSAVADCEASCLLSLSGRLVIGGRRYPLSSGNRGAASVSAAGEAARTEFSLSPAAARLGRAGLERGARVKVVVSARARISGSGAARSAEQTVVLRP